MNATAQVSAFRKGTLDKDTLYRYLNFNGAFKGIRRHLIERVDPLFTEQDRAYMARIAAKLQKEGYTNVDISHILSYKKGWHPMAVNLNLSEFERSRVIPKNPNQAPEGTGNNGC